MPGIGRIAAPSEPGILGSVTLESTQPSLLSRVRDRTDQAAWREFDAKYRGLLLGYARARGLQEADAADMLQLVMLGLMRSLENFEYRPELGRFRDYLRRIVRNAIAKLLSRPRSERQALWDEELDLLASSEDTADDLWDREWMRHHFRQALRRARGSFSEQSVALFDACVAGKSVAEVAGSFGVSPDVVYKTKQRMRKSLEQLIAEQIRDEEFPERS